MPKLRYQLDITGIKRSDLTKLLASQNHWGITENKNIFAQKPSTTGGYVKGGPEYASSVLSLPFSILLLCELPSLGKLLKESTALANKSCRYKLLLPTENLSSRQLSNILSELLQIQHYIPKLLLSLADFSPAPLNTETISTAPKTAGISVEEGTLVLDFAKMSLAPSDLELLSAFTVFIYAVIQYGSQRKTVLLPHPLPQDNEKFRFRTYMVRIGLKGKEYKKVRELLTQHLTGNSAWLHPQNKPNTNQGNL